MPLLDWKEEFNLGVELFDTHHRHMVTLLNSAHDRCLTGGDAGEIAATLDELFAYANQHFFDEERYMEERDYAHYAEHLELHRSFATQAEVMQKDLRDIWEDLPLEKIAFLKSWLLHDILVADSDYVRSGSSGALRECA